MDVRSSAPRANGQRAPERDITVSVVLPLQLRRDGQSLPLARTTQWGVDTAVYGRYGSRWTGVSLWAVGGHTRSREGCRDESPTGRLNNERTFRRSNHRDSF